MNDSAAQPARAPGKGRLLVARVAGNFAWGMTAELAARGALFLVTVYLANILGTRQFGEFAFLQTIFMFLWMGADLGLNMYATREVARRPDAAARLLPEFTAMRFLLALALAVPALGVLRIAYGGGSIWYVSAGFCLYLLARAVQPDWLLRGLERYRALASVNIVTAAILLACTYLMIRSAEDFGRASLPWFLAYVAGTIGIAGVVLRDGMSISWRAAASPASWWRHWSESLHFTLSSGVSTFYQNIPLLYVYWLGSPERAGLFAAPLRLITALLFVASVFPMTLYPVLTDLFNRGNSRMLSRLVGWSASLMVVGTGLASVTSWFFAEPLITRLFGAKYVDGAVALRWLAVFLLLRSVRAIFVRVVCGAGHQRRYSAVSIIAVPALMLALSVATALGIEPIVAAAAALSATELVFLLTMGWLTAQCLKEAELRGRMPRQSVSS